MRFSLLTIVRPESAKKFFSRKNESSVLKFDSGRRAFPAGRVGRSLCRRGNADAGLRRFFQEKQFDVVGRRRRRGPAHAGRPSQRGGGDPYEGGQDPRRNFHVSTFAPSRWQFQRHQDELFGRHGVRRDDNGERGQ